MYAFRVTVSAVGLFQQNRTYVSNFYKENKTLYDKNMKRDSASANVHMKRDTPLPLLDEPPPFP